MSETRTVLPGWLAELVAVAGAMVALFVVSRFGDRDPQPAPPVVDAGQVQPNPVPWLLFALLVVMVGMVLLVFGVLWVAWRQGRPPASLEPAEPVEPVERQRGVLDGNVHYLDVRPVGELPDGVDWHPSQPQARDRERKRR